MCHSRTLNNKMNRIQERALRIVYNDYKSNFKELLERDHSFTVHERNIKYLAIEAFEVRNGLSPVIMEGFAFLHFGRESINTLGAKIWDLIQVEMKASKSLMTFKKKIKNWTPKSCPCRLCRIYIDQVGFMN